jgi:hypothetical protein
MGRRTYGGGPHAARNSPDDIRDANTEFAAQAQEFGFIYDCRHCIHIGHDGTSCSMDYPNLMLWDAATETKALDTRGHLVFCKYFENS